ncbi:MAG: hypothetical protein IKT50_00675, partial [Clostridia bacterium]|nr:hypothetical protein [Clostridia bacterium]
SIKKTSFGYFYYTQRRGKVNSFSQAQNSVLRGSKKVVLHKHYGKDFRRYLQEIKNALTKKEEKRIMKLNTSFFIF